MAESLGLRYTASQDGVIKATWKLKVAWSEVDQYVEDAFTSSVSLSGTKLVIGVTTLPGKDYLVLSGLTLEPFDTSRPDQLDDNGLPTFTTGGAILTLTFETVQYEFNGGGGDDDTDEPSPNEPYLEHTIAGSMQIVTHSNAVYKWETTNGAGEDENVPEDIRPGHRETVLQHQLTWQRVLNPPITSLRNMLGTVNAATFIGFQKETMLFSSLNASYKLIKGEQKLWTLGIQLDARLINGFAYDAAGAINPGWNHFPRPDANLGGLPEWQRLIYKDSGAYIYPTSDFDNLLTLFNAVQPTQREAQPR